MKCYPPIGEKDGKKEQIEAMFDAIAPRYDLLNRVLSLGVDRHWRKTAIDLLAAKSIKRVLDVATGTGDLAIEALRLNPRKVVGVDISDAMLKRAREKVARLGKEDRVVFQRGSAERLPFSDRQFDAALVGFGVRNFQHLDQGLREIRRVLRPGGALVVLEFGQPEAFPTKQLYGFYSRFILPSVGRALSRVGGAYRYLPESIAAFPYGEAFLESMRAAGFRGLEYQMLTFGVASLYTGTTPA